MIQTEHVESIKNKRFFDDEIQRSICAETWSVVDFYQHCNESFGDHDIETQDFETNRGVFLFGVSDGFVGLRHLRVSCHNSFNDYFVDFFLENFGIAAHAAKLFHRCGVGSFVSDVVFKLAFILDE